MTLQEALKEQMKNKDFKREYDALEAEYKNVNSVLKERNLQQKQKKTAKVKCTSKV